MQTNPRASQSAKGLQKLQCESCKSCLTLKCSDCDVPKCQTCCSVHQNIENLSVTSDARENQDTKCNIHLTEDLEFYCEACKYCICNLCTVNGHKGHNYIKVKDIVAETEQKLSAILASIKYTDIPIMRSKVNSVQSSRDENKRQGEVALNNINSRMDELIEEIEKVRQKLIEESKELEIQNEEHLNEIELLLKTDLCCLETLYTDCKQVLSNGSDTEKILTEQKICMELDELHSHDTDMVLALPLFYPGNIDLKSLQKSFGLIDTQMVSCSEFQSSVFTNEEANVDIISSFNHNSKDILSILTLNNGLAWVHSRGEFDNEEVDKYGKIQKVLGFDYMVNDFGLISDDEFLVSAGNTTYIYKMTHDLGVTEVIDTSPLQALCLCVSKDGNILVGFTEKWSFTVGDNSKRLVARMTVNGQILETFEYNGDCRLFVLLWGIDENKNGDICVVNKNSMTNGHLVIMESTGKLKTVYNGSHADKHFDATDVKCDDLGFIIISDCLNRKIHLLNSDGQLIQYLMSSRTLTFNPDALCVDNQGQLWIGCHGGQIIIIKY